MLPPSIWIGFDRREAAAFAVAVESVRRNLNAPIPVYGLVLRDLIKRGLYTRPIKYLPGVDGDVMWDVISDAPMSTEFAVSRFLVPHLVKMISAKTGGFGGWALFMDPDVLVRSPLTELFKYNSDHQQFAVRCVKHDHRPSEKLKMDGQPQTSYARKNWSSVMMFNVDHPANAALTPELINTLPGRDLHRFCWLDDSEIGELGPEWNWLVDVEPQPDNPKIVHHTLGTPAMRGYENAPFADEWRDRLDDWARGPLSLPG